MRNRNVIPAIVLLFCALSILYYVQVDTSTSTQDTHNKNSSNSDNFLLPILESGFSPKKIKVEDDDVDVNLEPCQCSRRLARRTTVESVKLSETTCSEASFARGGHQKVVSFSYYEKNKKLSMKRLKTGKIKENIFLRGLQINVDLLPRLYPGRSVGGESFPPTLFQLFPNLPNAM